MAEKVTQHLKIDECIRREEMKRKVMLLVVIGFIGAVIGGGACTAGKAAVNQVLPVEVKVVSVEKMYADNQAVVLRLNLELYNPNDVLARVDALNYSVYVDVGRTKIALLNGQYNGVYLPGKGRLIVKDANAATAMTILYAFLMKGLSGSAAEATAGVGALFAQIADDTAAFKVEGDMTTVLPDYPKLGSISTSLSLK
jgi:LEA14-like dessication related protein